MKWLDSIPLSMLVVASLLLGLAPFVPEPHIVGKIRMTANGTLIKPIDILDLAYHALPVVLLIMKLVLAAKKSSDE
ncbi:MAG: RND transporter [Desulfobulbaceae bacterium]|nr:RND transporter [Desulfobulbaceae bacterium]